MIASANTSNAATPVRACQFIDPRKASVDHAGCPVSFRPSPRLYASLITKKPKHILRNVKNAAILRHSTGQQSKLFLKPNWKNPPMATKTAIAIWTNVLDASTAICVASRRSSSPLVISLRILSLRFWKYLSFSDSVAPGSSSLWSSRSLSENRSSF